MFNLAAALKSHRDAGSVNEQINLFGFIDDSIFLTKSGDLGAILSVKGVDYECLDANGIDACTKRLESSFKMLDDRCRIYQYLIKGNRPSIPHRLHDNPVVRAAIENRIAYLRSKANTLYSLSTYFVVLLEAPSTQQSVLRTLSNGNGRAWTKLKTVLSSKQQISLLDAELRGPNPSGLSGSLPARFSTCL